MSLAGLGEKLGRLSECREIGKGSMKEHGGKS